MSGPKKSEYKASEQEKVLAAVSLADKNLFNPILSMWLPNLIILGFGLLILRYKN